MVSVLEIKGKDVPQHLLYSKFILAQPYVDGKDTHEMQILINEDYLYMLLFTNDQFVVALDTQDSSYMTQKFMKSTKLGVSI